MSQQVRNERYNQSIQRLERDIVPQYLEGCIHWVDTIYDGAWSALSERYERILKLFLDGKLKPIDYEIEEEIFFENMQSYMEKYRTYKKLDERQDFIKSFEKEKYQYGY